MTKLFYTLLLKHCDICFFGNVTMMMMMVNGRSVLHVLEEI